MTFLRYLTLLLALPLTLAACSPAAQPLRPDQLSFAPLVFQVPDVERLELPNGIRLYLREDHELPLVQVTAMIGAGSIGDPADKTGLADLFAATLRNGGAGDYSPDAFDEALAHRAADLSIAADTYAVTLDLSLQAADLQVGLELLGELLKRPAFDSSRLELARKQMLEGIRRRDDNPASLASRALMAALYGEHPLGRTPTEASVAAVSREDLLAFHHNYFHPDNLWLAVSGDFDRAELLRFLDVAFGGWPRVPFTPQPLPPLSAAGRPAVVVAAKDLPQTTILMGEVGVDKFAPDLDALRVMNYILGGGGFNSRMMREVRSNRGLAYSVYSHFQVGRRLPGPFVAGCETKSASTMEVVALMRRLMGEMRSAPVSADELALAKESLINSFVFAFDDSHAVLTQTMRLDYYGYPAGYLEGYRDRVAAVTAEDVLRVARQRLHPERQTVVLVGEEDAFDAPPTTLGLPVSPVPSGD